MGKVLIIGAGGVGNVVARKCAMLPGVFEEICLASRTLEKCERIAAACERPIRTARLDAERVPDTVGLIRDFGADLVVHVALPYQNLAIMDACLEAGVDYLDTANYESPENPRFAYSYQWDYHDRFREAGILGVLGCGFDPGVTSIFCTGALRGELDEIRSIDILDCNAGEHGHPFATNFNPEINIREITQPGRYWEDGEWIETEPLAVQRVFDFPEIGPTRAYLLYHEELESLVRFIPGLRRIRFWMTFGDEYLEHLRVLQNVGMTRIDPVDYEGHPVVPVRFLKALLPDPSSLGPQYRGKTCIGCLLEGVRDGKPRTVFIYNVCDHAKCWQEAGAQATSYTTGVPASIGAQLILDGVWRGEGVYNVEQMDPLPFLGKLSEQGLPWHVKEV